MSIFRGAVAFPFYAIGMALHLLTAFFTLIAQRIAGEDHESPYARFPAGHRY
jgi:hypothetical protein